MLISNKNKKTIAFYVLAPVLLLLGLSWKPLVIVAWRLSHSSSAEVGTQTVKIPFPWVITRSQGTAKAKAFETLWPVFNSREITAIMEETPLEQQRETALEWSDERRTRFASAGYSNIRGESFRDGAIVCSEATKGASEIAYCRSNTKLNLVYSGPLNRLGNAIDILPQK